jgi:hypothetical protein
MSGSGRPVSLLWQAGTRQPPNGQRFSNERSLGYRVSAGEISGGPFVRTLKRLVPVPEIGLDPVVLLSFATSVTVSVSPHRYADT